MRLCTATFTSSGTWTCPAGVTQIIVHGQGGGQGGTGGFNAVGTGAFGGYGGRSACLVPVLLTVVPNTTYSITIGTGGNGGGPNGPYGSGFPWVGTATTFSSLATFYPAGIAGATSSASGAVYTPGPSPALTGSGLVLNMFCPDGDTNGATPAAYSGNGLSYGTSATKGSRNGASTGGGGGQGGNSSDYGPGGNGGNGANGGTPATAGQAATSYGAGGGGGGGGNASGGSTTGGVGGNGGPGRLIITWAE